MGQLDVFMAETVKGDWVIVDLYDGDVAGQNVSLSLSKREATSLISKLTKTLNGEPTSRPRWRR
jgi:hypothetical protein